MLRKQGGVPIVPYQRFIHDFPDVDPGRLPRKTFRKYFMLTCITGGLLFAFYTVDNNQIRNTWYNRPDLKPYPAMVPIDTMDVTQRTALEAHSAKYRAERAK
jgi:hypothetical protein